MDSVRLGSPASPEPEEPPSPSGTSEASPHKLTISPNLAPALRGRASGLGRTRESFPIGTRARAFRRRFFPEVGSEGWSDWRWQLRRRIKSLAELERVFRLSEDERDAVARHQGSLPVGITPYYASLLDRARHNRARKPAD